MPKQKHSGLGFPAVKSRHLEGKMSDDTEKVNLSSVPMPVALVPGTLWKMMGIFLIPTLGLISAGFCIYWRMDAHMSNGVIHTSESKVEQKVDVKLGQGIDLVKKEVKLQIEEVKLQQEKQFSILGDKLKEDQLRILEEVKRTRKAVIDQP